MFRICPFVGKKQKGLQFKPSDLSRVFSNYAVLEPSLSQLNVWQESTAVTPISATTQVVGRIVQLDTVTLGTEISTGNDFSAWSISAGSVVKTNLTFTTNGPSGLIIGGSFPVGAEYLVTVSGSTTATNLTIATSATSTGSSITIHRTGFGSVVITIPSGQQYLYLRNASAGTTTISSVSVVQYTANEAVQATTANKPTYQLDAFNVPVLRHDTTDLLTFTPKADMGATASVYYATGSGVTQAHNVNVGTSYSLPGKPGAGTADVYGWIITPSRPSTAVESNIVKYLSKKAGL